MAFDGVVLHAVIDELGGLLTGGRVEKIFQPEPGELVLLIHAAGEHYRLLLSADPASARIHLTRSKKENPALPPPFCMVLRKYLTGSRITAIRQRGFDRVAEIEFETRSEMGDNISKTLVLEIMNRQSNIILLNAAGVIHDAIRHADNSVNRFREIMPARPYTPPPAQDKLTPPELTDKAVLYAINSAAGNTVSKCLLSIAAGFSPLLCDAICIDAGIMPETPPAALTESEKICLTDALEQVKAGIIAADYHPALIKGGKDYHCLSVCARAFGADSQAYFNTVNLAIDSFFTSKTESERFQREKSGIMREISGNIEKLSKKLQEYRRELDDAAGFEREKQLGDLLTASLYSLPEFASEVTVTDFYSPENTEITLKLDQSRSVAANAQLYYKKYRKHKAATETVGKLAARVRADLDYLENVSSMLANSESFDELSDIRAELRAEMPSGTTSKTGSKEPVDPKFPPSAYMGGKPASKKSLRARANAAKSKSAAGKGGKGDPSGARDADRSEEAGLTRPIQRVSPSGRRIMIGRNSRQNERLTLRDAAPEDMWFHVKNAPGSHVVLKLKEAGVNTADDADIESAAALAAYYSSQRSGSKVDVDYTAVKNVKKIPGGKPGMVTYTNFKTITVKPADI